MNNIEKCFENFQIARQKAVEDTDYFFNEKKSAEEERKAESFVLPIFKSGVEPVNFVYGELEFREFYGILSSISQKSWFHSQANECMFLDLGCGAGKLSAYQYLLTYQTFEIFQGSLISFSFCFNCGRVLYGCCSVLTGSPK